MVTEVCWEVWSLELVFSKPFQVIVLVKLLMDLFGCPEG